MATEWKVVQCVYDFLSEMYTGGGSESMILLNRPGIVIRTSDYRNPWSPDNQEGSQPNLERFSSLVNVVPKSDPTYVNSGNSMYNIYQELLEAETISDSGISSKLSRARQMFNQTKRASLFSPGTYYHEAYAIPENWYNKKAKDFKSFSIDCTHLRSVEKGDKLKSMFQQVEGGAPVELDNDSNDDDLKISFEIKRVEINRPWLDASLFKLNGIKVSGRGPGSFSEGNMTKNDGIFPLLITSMILVRNVTVEAAMNNNTDEVQKSASSGFGLFASSEESRVKWDDQNGRFVFKKIPDLQILAWIASVIPFCPPEI